MYPIPFQGDSPNSRFGHTTTPLSKSYFLLYGGATGSAGKYSITSDLFLFDCISKFWSKIDALGTPPAPRAAHAATNLEGGEIAIYGGAAGGGGLSSDEVHILRFVGKEDKMSMNNNFTNGNWIWGVMTTTGTSPGRRYGHTIVYSKPYIIVFGGHIGNEPSNDVFTLLVDKGSGRWMKVDTKSVAPPPRVYHTASLCTHGSASGMMVIFGGRGTTQSALGDAWGLRRHRDGRWDWVKAPSKKEGTKPTPRYQHTSFFINSLMVVVGGRRGEAGKGEECVEIYDTQSSDWWKFGELGKFRHSSWICDGNLYVFGGFGQKSPNVPTDELIKINLTKLFQGQSGLIKSAGLEIFEGKMDEEGMGNPKSSLKDSSVLNMQNMNTSFNNANLQNPNKTFMSSNSNNSMIKSSLQQRRTSTTPLKNIRLASQAVVAYSYDPEEEDNKLVKRLSIDKLQEESKKLGIGFKDNNQTQQPVYVERLFNLFISQLLIPFEFSWDLRFNLKKELILKLCEETQKILENEDTLLHLTSPLKIYGNLNGQLGDLMKLFEHFGTPTESLANGNGNGDIEGFTYLFLGDYVDLGLFSVEVICLLLALKLKHPDGIYLLRGRHEDEKVNKIFGLGQECAQKFNEDIDDSNSVFKTLNRLFEFLPVAALVEGKIFCVHGGIGANLKSVNDLEYIRKPIKITEPKNNQEKMILDVIFSDPMINEGENKNQLERDFLGQYYNFTYKVRKFGVERLKSFVEENTLKMVVRSNECCKGGKKKYK